MATKRFAASAAPTAAFARAKKYCLKMFGSSVLPDLLETMNSVRDGSMRLSTVRICAGSVESSTCSLGKPGCGAKGFAEHLGAEARPAHAEQQEIA